MSTVAPHLGLLNKVQTEFFLGNMKSAAQNIANNLLDSIKNGLSDEEIINQFKEKYWHGYIKEKNSRQKLKNQQRLAQI